MDPRAKHVYHQYTIKVRDRNKLIHAFKENKIGFGIYYPRGIHQQPIMQKLGFGSVKLPITEKLVNEVISIPVHPLISEDDISKVIKVIKENA